MSDTPKLMVHYRKHYTSKAWGDESWTAAREPTVPEVLAWLQDQNVGEEMRSALMSNDGAGMVSLRLVLPLSEEKPGDRYLVISLVGVPEKGER